MQSNREREDLRVLRKLRSAFLEGWKIAQPDIFSSIL